MEIVTAISAATAAFNGAKRLIEGGRELEDIAGQLGKWFTAAADVSNAEKENKSAPFYKKLLNKGSVEEEALQITIARQRLAEQEAELRTLISYRYGISVYKEMIELRREIKRKRENEVYRRRAQKRAIIEWTVGLLVGSIGLGAIVGFVALLQTYSS